MMFEDYILNGAGHGMGSEVLSGGSTFAGRKRPYYDPRLNACFVSVHTGGDMSDPKNYRTIKVNAATLRRDEWKRLDDAVLAASRYRLGGVEDLESRGLVYNLGNGFATTTLEWHDVNDGFNAVVSMDGITRGKGDRVTYQHNYLPIPVIHVDYEINARVLEVSRTLGNGLDTTSAEQAARRISEKLEKMLFGSETYSFGEKDSRGVNTIYSYITHPDRNKMSLSVNWDASGKTPKAIIDEVLAMKQDSINALHYGPWVLYVPTAYETILDGDYDTTTPGTTIRDRILKISGIEGIRVNDTLPANNVLLVQMTADVVRLIKGLPIQNIQWGAEGDFVNKFKVITIQVPQIRSDRYKKSGIVHLAAH